MPANVSLILSEFKLRNSFNDNSLLACLRASCWSYRQVLRCLRRQPALRIPPSENTGPPRKSPRRWLKRAGIGCGGLIALLIAVVVLAVVLETEKREQFSPVQRKWSDLNHHNQHPTLLIGQTSHLLQNLLLPRHLRLRQGPRLQPSSLLPLVLLLRQNLYH